MVPQLITTGFIGCFAKPVVTIPLLLDIAEIPADIFNLFLSVGVVAGRFGDLMKSMHLFAFSILTACYLSGAARFRFGRLLTRGLTTVVVLVLSVTMIRSYLYYSFQDDYCKANLVVARELLGLSSDYTVLDRSEPNPDPLEKGEDRMDRILRRGLIRIGVDTDQLPFSYFNQDGKLVGFDIDMAHQLARDLGVGIEFVPISDDICQLLRADHFDLAMSGLEGTIKRATELPEMEPYMEVTRAFVVPDHLRREFQTVDRLVRLTSVETIRVAYVAGSIQSERLATDTVLGTGYAVMKTAGIVDKVELVELKTESDFFESDPPVADVLATNAEGGSAWTLKYPGYTVAKPQGWDAKSPLHYFVADQSQFREFMNSWLKLKRRNGTIQQLYDYWILGHDSEDVTPRWCILRNVLHWVD
jgi:ABC-type amino acid transport substrate-binding protein